MSGTDPEPDVITPAQRRLLELVATLRGETPEPATDLGSRVVRTARWQQAVRAPLAAIGRLAGTVAEGLGLLAGHGGRRGPR